MYIQPILLHTVNVKNGAKHMVNTIISTYCLFAFLSDVFTFYFLCFGAMLSVHVLLRVDVQTGCVWAGVPLSVHLFAALILGFVCSIWAKFSNGDNYRGRPGERRRWVLPVYRVSCMLLQASQLHLPASHSVYPHFSH